MSDLGSSLSNCITMLSRLQALFFKLKKADYLKFSLLSILFVIAVNLYFGKSSSISSLEQPDFTARLNNLLYRLKPWCIGRERTDIRKFVVNDTDLESYCACIVGKIDQNFRIDLFDLTADRYRRAHPYVTIQLQLFRQHCIEEIK